MSIAKRSAWAVGLLALAAAFWLITARARLNGEDDARKAPPPSEPVMAVEAITPQRSTWPRGLAAKGSIAAWQEAIISARLGELPLLEVRVNVGDAVRKGQLLALLQSDTVEAEVAQARAGLAEAEANEAEARSNAARARQLASSGAISDQQIEQYATAQKTAMARVQSLKAKLRADELRLSHTRILSPDDGVISARSATLGAVVQAGQDLFHLILNRRIEWRAEMPSEQLDQLSPGMTAELELVGGAKITGRLRQIAPAIDPATRHGIAYVDLPVGAPARPGMFARGRILTGTAQALTVPQSAVLAQDGFSYVFEMNASNQVRQTRVTLGQQTGDRVEIVSGLDAQARIVASGVGFLGDGDLVRLDKPDARAPAVAAASQALH